MTFYIFIIRGGAKTNPRPQNMATRISPFPLFLFILVSYTSGLLNPRSLKILSEGNSESLYEYQTLYIKQYVSEKNMKGTTPVIITPTFILD